MKLFKYEKEKYKKVLYLFVTKTDKYAILTDKYSSLTDKYSTLTDKVNNLIDKNKNLEQELSDKTNTLLGADKIIEKKLNYNTMILTKEKNRFRYTINYLVEKLGFEDIKEIIIRQRFMFGDNVYNPNLKNPKSFNEKILWLCLHYYNENPEIARIGNKITFKDFVKERLGEGYTVPLIKVYDKVEDINYDELPNQFVIKTNWGGDGTQVKIIKDKSKTDIKKLNSEMKEWLMIWNGIYYYNFNGAYKNIEPKLLIEKYIDEFDRDDSDYKFFCFKGEPKLFYIANNWGTAKQKKLTYYNMNFENLNIQYNNFIRNKESKIEKPILFDEMVQIARKLSKGFPFVRVDLNPVKDKIYAGELTFTPGGGISTYNPVEWDYKLGEMLDISDIIEEYNNRKK